MTSTTLTTVRRFALLAVTAALLLAMLPAAPSQADPQAVAVAGTAYLPTFNNDPNFDSGCFSGTAAGTLNGSASASFSYRNSLLEGEASGQLNLPGTGHDVDFTWVRVGATAVLTLSNSNHTGNAVAVFAPVGPPSLAGPCGPGSPAQVAGVGVLS